MLTFDTKEELFLISRNSIKIINITLKITLLKKENGIQYTNTRKAHFIHQWYLTNKYNETEETKL